jgi:hypothetical protein
MFIVSSMEKTDPGMAYRIFDPDVIVTRSQSDDPRYYHTRWNHYPTQDPSDDVCRMDQRNGNGMLRVGNQFGSPKTKAKAIHRAPALGLTAEEASRFDFHVLRGEMLGWFIQCPGVTSKRGLLDLLELERVKYRVSMDDSNPEQFMSPVPDWYTFGDGSRCMQYNRQGLRGCASEHCFETDTIQTQLKACGGCRNACYCSTLCQTSDWKTRHKHMCRASKQSRKKQKQVAEACTYVLGGELRLRAAMKNQAMAMGHESEVVDGLLDLFIHEAKKHTAARMGTREEMFIQLKTHMQMYQDSINPIDGGEPYNYEAKLDDASESDSWLAISPSNPRGL